METTWTAGQEFTSAELASRYSIPKDEIDSFQETARIYPKGAIIIREGDTDRTLYLLRSGEVNVYKQVDQDEREQVGLIRAVNFFGELSLINGRARSATVEAYSGNVLVYAVDSPNIGLILGNPRWAELLVSRLSKDLARTSSQLAATVFLLLEMKRDKDEQAVELRAAQEERQAFDERVAKVLAVLAEFQKAIHREAIVGSRGWFYLGALNRLTGLIVRNYLPEVASLEQPTDLEMLRSCLRELEKSEPRSVYLSLLDSLAQDHPGERILI